MTQIVLVCLPRNRQNMPSWYPNMCFPSEPLQSTNGQLVVWVPVVWDSNRVPPSNNPFQNGIPGIQTTGTHTITLPNHDPVLENPSRCQLLVLPVAYFCSGLHAHNFGRWPHPNVASFRSNETRDRHDESAIEKPSEKKYSSFFMLGSQGEFIHLFLNIE